MFKSDRNFIIEKVWYVYTNKQVDIGIECMFQEGMYIYVIFIFILEKNCLLNKL